jgi:hypothetical protein
MDCPPRAHLLVLDHCDWKVLKSASIDVLPVAPRMSARGRSTLVHTQHPNGRTRTVPEWLRGGARESSRLVTALRLYDTSTEYELAAKQKTFLVGSGVDGAAMDMVIDRAFVSTRHCRLDRKLLGLRVEDLGSKNGTFLDGESAPFYLRPGKTLVVGALPNRLLALNDDMRAAYRELLDVLGMPEEHVPRGETPSPCDMILVALSNGHLLITSDPECEQARLARIVHGLSQLRARRIIERKHVPATAAKQRELIEAASGSTLVLDLGEDDTRLPSNFVTAAFSPRFRIRVIVLARGVTIADKALGEYKRRLQHIWLPPVASRPDEVDRRLDRRFKERRSSLRVSQMPPEDQSALRAHAWPDNFASLHKAAEILVTVHRLGSLPKAAAALKMPSSTLYHWYRKTVGLTLPSEE